MKKLFLILTFMLCCSLAFTTQFNRLTKDGGTGIAYVNADLGNVTSVTVELYDIREAKSFNLSIYVFNDIEANRVYNLSDGILLTSLTFDSPLEAGRNVIKLKEKLNLEPYQTIFVMVTPSEPFVTYKEQAQVGKVNPDGSVYFVTEVKEFCAPRIHWRKTEKNIYNALIHKNTIFYSNVKGAELEKIPAIYLNDQ